MIAVAAQAATPGVLIIHSNQRPTPAAIVVEDTLRETVSKGFGGPVEIFSEYLDAEWAAPPGYNEEQQAFLGHKYEDRNIRVIVASAQPALPFAIALRDHAFPRVPIVHIAFPKDQLDQTKLPPDAVGRTIDLDPGPTLALALRLHPNAKRLVFVLGAADRDRIWEQRVRSAANQLPNHLQTDYLVGLPTSEMLRRVGALPAGTIVFTPGYFRDGAGEVVTPRQSVEAIARASAAPVYGALDTFVGTGAVGGSVTPYEQQSREAGAIIVRLLNGESPAMIGASSVPQVPMVDWRAVKRWHIDPGLLPTGTIVKFRDPTAWDRYGSEISIGVGVLLLQAGLIVALLVERRSRRRTATALAESQEQLSHAARAAGLSPWAWELARKEVVTDRRSRPSTQDAQAAVAFESVVESAHPADRDNLKRATRHALATGEELDVEYRVVKPDGKVRWLAVRGRAEGQERGRLLGVALDVTDRKEEELRAAEDRAALKHMTRVATVGQLSAAIAHQLNQPLAAILGNAEAARKMLDLGRNDLGELREICSDIISEDHRATEVIRRLRELYGRGDMQTEPLDLNGLVRETLDVLHTELLIRQVSPATEFAPTLPAIEGQRVQLQQVVLNLVLNAADAMSNVTAEQRKLTIRTEGRDSEIRLLVRDNGSGIAEEHLKSVFAPFWSTKTDGMGMGLAICQSIVIAHRGTITVANNAEGGATFCVNLPARPGVG